MRTGNLFAKTYPYHLLEHHGQSNKNWVTEWVVWVNWRSQDRRKTTRQLVQWLLPGGKRQDLLAVLLSPCTNGIKADVTLSFHYFSTKRKGEKAKKYTLKISNKFWKNNDIMRSDRLPELIRVWLGAGVAVRVRFMPTFCWPVPSASAFLAAALSASVWLPWLTVTVWAAGKGCTTPVPFRQFL